MDTRQPTHEVPTFAFAVLDLSFFWNMEKDLHRKEQPILVNQHRWFSMTVPCTTVTSIGLSKHPNRHHFHSWTDAQIFVAWIEQTPQHGVQVVSVFRTEPVDVADQV
jgi:hypothetical protein